MGRIQILHISSEASISSVLWGEFKNYTLVRKRVFHPFRGEFKNHKLVQKLSPKPLHVVSKFEERIVKLMCLKP